MSYFARSRITHNARARREQEQEGQEEGGGPSPTAMRSINAGPTTTQRRASPPRSSPTGILLRRPDEAGPSNWNDQSSDSYPLRPMRYDLPTELPPVRSPIAIAIGPSFGSDQGGQAGVYRNGTVRDRDDPFQYDRRSPGASSPSPVTSTFSQRLSRKGKKGSSNAGGGGGGTTLPVKEFPWQPVISPPMPQGAWGGSGLGVDDDDGLDDASSPAPDYYYEARSDDEEDAYAEADLALASPHPLRPIDSQSDLYAPSPSRSLAGLNFVHPTPPPQSAGTVRPPFYHKTASSTAANSPREKLQQLVEEKLQAKYAELQRLNTSGVSLQPGTGRPDLHEAAFGQRQTGDRNPFEDHPQSPSSEKLSPFRDPSSVDLVGQFSLKERQGYRAPVSPGVEEILRYDGPTPVYATTDHPSSRPTGGVSPSKSTRSFESAKSQRSNKSSKTARTNGSHARAVGGPGAEVKTKRELRMEAARLKKRKLIVLGAVVGVCVLAIGIPVAYTLSKNATKVVVAAASNSTASARPTVVATNTSTSTYNASAYLDPENRLNPLSYPKDLSVQSGSDGSLVTSYINGSVWVFTYTNPFGGDYYYDPLDPYTLGGKAQSWSPRIGNETWTWGQDIVRGVNLGGWLVTEPFIVPALYESYPGAVDEWTLSQLMTAAGSDVLETQMHAHYESFIVEEDFAMIAAAGMNMVRLPLGFWAVETVNEEPFLEGVSWTYFVRAIGWARKYGLRILLDLHALPGSQNGWNHSGKSGSINWMYGVMGVANAQRTLNVIRTIAEFISQPQYSSVVTILSLVNEVEASIIGLEALQSFYYQAYQVVREASGLNQGPIILGHTGFGDISTFTSFMPGADRFALDQHPYLAFAGSTTYSQTFAQDWTEICTWSAGINASQASYGITLGGEWSPAINDCGLYLNGVGSTSLYETSGLGSCDQWNDWASWSEDLKANISQTALTTMDSLAGGWFAWTWKIGNATSLGTSSSPFWHVKLGLSQGWWPTDPRTSAGRCAALGAPQDIFSGTFPASATGAGDGVLTASALANYSAWPPTTISYSTSVSPFVQSQVALMPTWTQTGTPVTLTEAAVPSGGANAGNGWYATSDTAAAYATVSGCTYPDYWNATNPALLPTALCTGPAARKRGVLRARLAEPTPPPVRSADGQ